MLGEAEALDFLGANIAPVAGYWRCMHNWRDANFFADNGL
jgi:hypothetical protein